MNHKQSGPQNGIHNTLVNDKQLFMKNGYFCEVKKDIDESMERFQDRGYFIVSQGKNIDNIDTFSKVWANMKFDNSIYNKKLSDKIKQLESNI